MPDDFVDTEAAPVTATEREFDNTLSRAFDAWNGRTAATQTAEPEPEPEPEPQPEKPARKPSRAAKELAERPDFSEPEDEAEEQDEGKSRKADKGDKSKAKASEKDEEDDGLEKLEPPENARANTKADWHALKGKAKEYKSRVKELEPRVKELEAEIAELRAGKDSPPKKSVDDLTAEIDGLKPPKNPHQVDGFTRLKEASKERTALLKSEVQQEREARELAEAELTDWREGRGKLPPAEFQQQIEVLQKRVQELEPYDLRHKVSQHPDFVRGCVEPVNQTFHSILSDLVNIQGDSPEMQKWVGQMQNEVGPDAWGAAEWQEACLKNIRNDADRARVAQRVGQLLDLRQRRDAVRENLAQNPRAYDHFAQESRKQWWDNWREGTMKAEPQLVEEFKSWGEVKDEKTREAFKKDVYPIMERYLSMVADDTLPPAERGKHQAYVVGKLAAYELKNQKLEKELASARRETELLRRENGRMSQLRSVPAKAGGAQGKSKSGPSVDIFENNPFANGRGLGDDE
jgi:hypothetical protein